MAGLIRKRNRHRNGTIHHSNTRRDLEDGSACGSSEADKSLGSSQYSDYDYESDESSVAAVGIDPSRDDIPEDAYISCGGARSQILGRNMHAEYGTGVPVAAVHASQRRKQAEVVSDMGEDIEESETGSTNEKRPSKRRKTAAPKFTGCSKKVAALSGTRSNRLGTVPQQQQRGRQHRVVAKASAQLRELSGLWSDDDDEEEEEEDVFASAIPGDDDDDGDENDDEDGPPTPPPPNPPPPPPNPGDPDAAAIAARAREKCWLCTFSTHTLAKQVTSFVCSSVANMDTLHMAAQIKDEIMDRFPNAIGARKRDIIRHITEHMLAPNVKMAAVLRSLVTVAETLRGTMHQRDPVTDEVIVDLKSTEMYLKVLTQITTTYKMDGSKLMFCPPAVVGETK